MNGISYSSRSITINNRWRILNTKILLASLHTLFCIKNILLPRTVARFQAKLVLGQAAANVKISTPRILFAV